MMKFDFLNINDKHLELVMKHVLVSERYKLTVSTSQLRIRVDLSLLVGHSWEVKVCHMQMHQFQFSN